MTNKAINPTSLDDLAATVGFSVKEPWYRHCWPQ
jgi:hypothetical protein